MTLEELDKKIDHLNFRITLLLELVDPERNPFAYHLLESNVTEDQLDAIYALMDKSMTDILAGHGPDHHDFERHIYQIVPPKDGDYHFAEDIVSTLNANGQYRAVYEHMKQNGMNLS